ncbi:MAG: PASTA domain-containing protein [Clostridia bacterium]|nr:PASTA domain-containing protein [Clostridia bacterium]MBQ6707728.1 PASTA domain-containing protein [Clostridia bacterium]
MLSRLKQLTKQRAAVVTWILIIACFGLAIFGMIRVMLIQGDHYRKLAEENQLQDTEIAAQRGVIYDANMKPLAQSASAWKVYIRPSRIGDNAQVREEIAKRLSGILDVEYEEIMKKAKTTDYKYYSIKSKVEQSEKEKVDAFMKEECKDLKGEKRDYGYYIGVETDVKRYYPYSTFASTILGFTGTGDIGRYGLEYQYDSILTGKPGRIVTAQDGGVSSDDLDLQYETVYEAQQGTSIVLTLDSTIQRYLETAIKNAMNNTKAERISGIVMDTKTGAILAMANAPEYDLNKPQEVVNEVLLETINSIEDEKERANAMNEAVVSQWNNGAISKTYEPGSVFKVITAAAGIEENVVDENTSLNCTGSIVVADRTYHCHKTSGHGTQNFIQGLQNSCNPFFINVGQKLGVDKFYQYFEAFGFTEKTGIDLPGEAVPSAGLTYHAEEDRGPVQLASTSFGQSFELSQIQLITAVNAVANGGKLMKPYIVSKLIDENGNMVSQTEPVVKRQVISKSTASRVAAMMEEVVSSGTGKNAYVPGYRVAGKTGTSETLSDNGTSEEKREKYVASFAGFAPANDPEITIIVTLVDPKGEHGGGAVAAPIVGEVFEKTLKYLGVEPQYTEEEAATLDTKAPSVTGKSVDEATKELKDAGFIVKVMGSGKAVLSQIPAYNHSIPKGGTVVIYTEADVKNNKATVPDFKGMTIFGATQTAAQYGINIRVSGRMASDGSVTAYMQNIEAGATIKYGETVTVYFKSTSGVTDG